MRMEVFSGLIMLELVNIIEGKNETVYSVREGIKPKERNRSPETEQPNRKAWSGRRNRQ